MLGWLLPKEEFNTASTTISTVEYTSLYLTAHSAEKSAGTHAECNSVIYFSYA